MSITKMEFGLTESSDKIYEFKLENKNGNYVTVLNYGATIREIVVSDENKNKVDVCLGYNSINEYEYNDGYLGAIVGRHANRIKDGMFKINESVYNVATNDRGNHLHGGNKGFDKHIWEDEIKNDNLIFTRESKHMEEGYPGNLKIEVEYEFNDDDELVINYKAISDEDTVVNLTNHAYFNLNGEDSRKDILSHKLRLKASYFTENDERCLPTGDISSVNDTPFDFTVAKEIGKDINEHDIQLKNGGGYDHNFILDSKDELKYAGYLCGDESCVRMDIYTTCPGIQFYSGNVLSKRNGKVGNYKERYGLCLETQYYPNSMEHAHFPSVVLREGEEFVEKTIYKFSVESDK
ncbi:MAG: aldose epimerase family protein [Peptostreptococcaceae bacterium]